MVTMGAPQDLTDDQIDALLSRATTRLRQQEQRIDLSDADNGGSKAITFPKLDAGKTSSSIISTRNNVTRPNSEVLREQEQNESSSRGYRKVEDPSLAKQRLQQKKKASAGEMWFDLPKTNLTPELKRDLQLLKMRNVLDPHRHYKKDGGKMNAPEFSQIGTITEGATEFYSGRIENKKRKRTFVEEVLAGEHETGKFKKKYNDIQASKASGKKSFHKKLQAKRRNGGKKGG